MSTSVVYETLSSVAGRLHQAAVDLDDLGSTAPAAVDAGDMTSLVSAIIARVCESAGGLAEGLAAAGQQVQESAASYSGADDAAADSFRLRGMR